MFARDTKRRPNGADTGLAMLIGVALMVSTYAVFSIRTVLDPYDPGEWLSIKRLITVAAGAGLFLLVAAQVRRDMRRLSARVRSLVLTVIAGIAAMFVLRLGFDWISGETQAVVAKNARWLLTWLGYFAAAVAGYCATLFVRAGRPSGTVAGQIEAAIAHWPQEQQLLLLERLSHPVYEESDPDPLRRRFAP